MSNDRANHLGGEQTQTTTFLAVSTYLGGRLHRGCASAALAIIAFLAQMPSAQAAIECIPISQPLVKIPELVSQNGVLRGTMLLQDVQERVMLRNTVKPGVPGAAYECQPQWVRAFRGLDAQPPVPPEPYLEPRLPDPLPGPTLRARVGDIVELTFVNQLDPAKFGATHDNGVKGDVQGCDTITGNADNPGYPYKSVAPDKVPGDTFPDCFHGSSTANIHFHGTHTNPNGTADNVFLELQPSPRVNNQPTITPETYKTQFDAFFAACEQQLRRDPLAEWPSNWYGPNDPQHPGGSSLGPWTQSGTWTFTQMSLLDASDQAANTAVAQADQWPQHYIGAYPYCFQLPLGPSSFPPPSGGIQMGQAPGTHWYHAHKHGSTAIDVANGMVGAFIIEGKYDDDLDTFYGPGWTRTQPVLVLNQTGIEPNLKRGPPGRPDSGQDFSVNGRAQPIVDMAPGEVQLWRIVNGSGRSGAFINGFPPGFNFRQIAQDGVQFADVNYQNSQNQALLLASGNRADLLVQAPRTPGLYPLLVQHDVDPADLPVSIPVVLLQIRVREGVPPVTGNRSQFIPTAPEQPAFLGNITDAEVNGHQTIKFQTVRGPKLQPGAKSIAPFTQHMINGHKFDDEGSVPVPVTLNTVEEWKIMNYTFGPPISHPFHIHLNPFQIVEVFNPNATVQSRQFGTVPKYVIQAQLVDSSVQCPIDPSQESTWKDCHNDTSDTPRVWWDVFPIPSGGQIGGQNVPGFFRMRSRFVDYPGNYVIHCHILAHEDRGMMAIVELQPAGAPKPMLMSHH